MDSEVLQGIWRIVMLGRAIVPGQAAKMEAVAVSGNLPSSHACFSSPFSMADDSASQPPPNRPRDRDRPRQPQNSSLSPEKYARLKAETQAPYRGVRRFFYFGSAASGAMGAFIFLTQALAGRDVSQALPNLALQLGVIALMVWLLRIDQAKTKA